MEMIEVQDPRDLPNCVVIGFRAKSVEEIRKWAEQRRASQVWYYRHKVGQTYTAVMMMAVATSLSAGAGVSAQAPA